ncbi:MAG: PAS domain S-box protein [Terracidiphilus sp.]
MIRTWKRTIARYALAPASLAAAIIPATLLHDGLPRTEVTLIIATAIISAVLAALAGAWIGSANTGKKEAAEALRQGEEKIQAILANLSDVSWTVDRDHRIVYISPKVEELLGYSSEEIRGGGEAFVRANVHPADQVRVKGAMEALFVSGRPLDEEFRFRTRSGAWVWVNIKALRTRKDAGAAYADGLLSDVTRRKQAEIELQTKTALLEAQGDSTIDGFLVVDPNMRRILENRRVIEMFEIPDGLLADPDQIPMRRHMLLQMVNPDAFLALLDRLYAHPEETSRDELGLKDGRTLELYSSPVRGQGGEYLGRLWTFRDITERKRQEQELKAKAAFLEAQANATIDGVLVVDANDRRILTNQRLIEFFSVPAEILEQQANAPLLEHILQLVKDPETFLEKIRYVDDHAAETSRDEIELKDGRVFDRYSASVIDKDWNYFGRVSSFRDITEQKRNERSLRQLSAAVEQSPVSVIITDPKGNITYVNPRFTQVTGYTLEEAVGKNPRILNSGYSTRETYERLWETILQGQQWRGEFRNRKKNGEHYWEASVITPILDSTGAITSFLAVTEDVTERRALESELRQAQKLEGIGQLAAGIAHEINTPTQFVTDNLTFLMESWESAAPLLKLYRSTIHSDLCCLEPLLAAEIAEMEKRCDLDFIVEEAPRAIGQSIDGARRVANIVRAMKEFSHPDSDAKTHMDLNKGILSTITVARSEWKYVAEIRTEFDETLPPVVCYPGEINQVILNLVVNAAHAIRDKGGEDEKGQITIRTRRSGDYAEIAISDTGTGIPEDIQHRIYEPFFTTKEVGAGTGQGLAFSHSVVVKKHQGKIWFETELGRGTTFHIQLPIDGANSAKEE